MTNEDAISREAVIRLVEQYPNIIGNRCSGLIADIKHLPPITPSYNSIKSELKPCGDCISRIEAIENFANWYGYDYDNQGYYRLLKQMPAVTPEQPFINKSCISEGVCHEDKVNVLEKIRAEIEKLNPVDSGVIYSFGARDMKEEVLGIIDKYKAESEDKK